MAAVGTVAIITATPESADELAQLLTTLVESTHKEPGCILYSLERSIRHPAVFVTVEKWESPEAFAEHGKSAHMAEFAASGKALFAERPRVVVTMPMKVGDPAKYSY